MCWLMQGRTSHMEYQNKVQLLLYEFSDQKLIIWLVYVYDSSTDFNCDMIIGQDVEKELEIVLDFSAETMI